MRKLGRGGEGGEKNKQELGSPNSSRVLVEYGHSIHQPMLVGENQIILPCRQGWICSVKPNPYPLNPYIANLILHLGMECPTILSQNTDIA